MYLFIEYCYLPLQYRGVTLMLLAARLRYFLLHEFTYGQPVGCIVLF